jgi:hypothetical protein
VKKILLTIFLILSTSNLFCEETGFKYARELFLNEQYTRATYQFDSLIISSNKNDQHIIAGLSASLWMLGDTKTAEETLNSMTNKTLAEKLRTALEVSSGNFEKIQSTSEGQKYLNELHALEADPYKSPSLAALYSALLPGAGHIYLGAYQSAAVVFAFNVLTGLSTIEFANKHLTAPAIVSGVLFSIFYAGGIYSSYDGAVKMNQMKISKPKKELNVKYFPILKLEF